MSNPDQSPALLPEAAWPAGTRGMLGENAYDADQMRQHFNAGREFEAGRLAALAVQNPTEAAAMAATVPAGYVLVPLVPTDDQRNAPFVGRIEDQSCTQQAARRDEVERVYKAMLAAAPQAPVAGQPAEPSPADSAYLWTVERASTYRGYNVSRFIRGTIRQEWLGANGKVRRASPSNFRSPETAQAAIDKFNRLAAPKGDSNG